jgi:cytochrome c oxidase subunit 2
VKPDQFQSWVENQKRPAAIGAVAPAPATGNQPPAGGPQPATRPQALPAAPSMGAQIAANAANAPSTQAVAYQFPENQPEFDYAKPHTPIPAGMTFTRGLTGNAHRGQQVFSTNACVGCHAIAGNPAAVGNIGPNLTHFGSRATIGAGSYPNTPAYLALWIKNARVMKPGILMPTLGKDQTDPILKQKVTTGGLDDQQIADIVAYLWALK